MTAAVSDTRPFALFEWMLASRYLRSRRKEGFISVIAGFSFIGIMLGVATLIIVMAVMNGFRNELFSKILGLNGHIIVNKIGGNFEDYEQIAKRIVRGAGRQDGDAADRGPGDGDLGRAGDRWPRARNERGRHEGPAARRQQHPLRHASTASRTRRASPSARGSPTFCASTSATASLLVSPRGATTPFGNAPRTKPYVVTALFEMGMSEYDRTMMFMPLAEAQRYFSRGPEVDALEIVVDNPGQVDEFVKTIRAAAGPTVHVSDWRQRNETFFTVLEVERNVMFIILSLIVLVAALNIISGLMMLVKDKGRDVAILRTMGATRGAMMRVFLITGASIGVVGTLAGLVLGIVFCLNIEAIRELMAWITNTTMFDPNVYYLTRLPADMDVRETASIVAMALVLSVLATLYPSWRASTLDPVEALRYE